MAAGELTWTSTSAARAMAPGEAPNLRTGRSSAMAAVSRAVADSDDTCAMRSAAYTATCGGTRPHVAHAPNSAAAAPKLERSCCAAAAAGVRGVHGDGARGFARDAGTEMGGMGGCTGGAAAMAAHGVFACSVVLGLGLNPAGSAGNGVVATLGASGALGGEIAGLSRATFTAAAQLPARLPCAAPTSPCLSLPGAGKPEPSLAVLAELHCDAAAGVSQSSSPESCRAAPSVGTGCVALAAPSPWVGARLQ